MSDLQDLIHKTSIDCIKQGERQATERIIKIVEGWARPRYAGTPSSTPEEIALLDDLVEAIKREQK